MADGDNEPTWGADSFSTPSPAPHSDYHRQAAQHFEENPSPGPYQVPAATPTAQSSFPVITPQTSLPVQPAVPTVAVPPRIVPPTYTPPTYTPPVAAPQAHTGATYQSQPLNYQLGGYPPRVPADTFVTRLVERGVRGELLRQPWFQQWRATQPDVVVFVSFAVAFVLTGLFWLIGSNFVADLLTVGLWAGVAYLYFALGTRLSHQFLLWGICLAGGVSMLLRVILLLVGGRTMFWFHGWGDPLPVYILNVLLDIAVAAALGYVGIQMNREIAKLSRP